MMLCGPTLVSNVEQWSDTVNCLSVQLHCCAVYNYSDWLHTEWHAAHPTESYPPSCCVNNSCNYTYVEYDSAGDIDPHLYLKVCNAMCYRCQSINQLYFLTAATRTIE